MIVIAFDLSLSNTGYAVGEVSNNSLKLIEGNGHRDKGWFRGWLLINWSDHCGYLSKLLIIPFFPYASAWSFGLQSVLSPMHCNVGTVISYLKEVVSKKDNNSRIVSQFKKPL
ncbi:hypothetical protein BSA145_12530 [Bacillus safensis]|uniref:Uncharacterized protein n=1 Tax=Bacillus safensis TaxID=561879 RepID=A0A1L6ZJA4_BACIA|nr:hypothetical protein BSA145_12530 [Bacillus safensis]